MKSKSFPYFSAVVLAALAVGTYLGAVWAPTEETMGDAQRIFYYHVPAAVNAYTLFFVNFLASMLYLWKRSKLADAWALTAAEVGVVCSTVVLITGPIWARYAWGHWWAWDMRLTTFTILWLLYVSYLVLRRSSEAGSSSVLAAVLAICAFMDVPISYMANRWFRTNHPQPVIGTPNLDPTMQNVLFFNMLAFLAFAGLIAWFRFALERREQKIAETHVFQATRSAGVAMLAPALLLFQEPHHASPRSYMVAAYIAAWVIYAGYILVLCGKLARIKREESELHIR